MHFTHWFAVLLLLLASFTFGQHVEFRSDRAVIRFEQGEECRLGRGTMNDCKRFATGETMCEIENSDHCSFAFEVTETKGMDPFEVKGVIAALYLTNITQDLCTVSGMMHVQAPVWDIYEIHGKTGKPSRIFLKEERGKTLSYSWVEVTVYGHYDPELPSAKALREEFERQRAAKAEL